MLVYSHSHIQRRLYDNLSKGIREQDILYSYYLSSYYRPSDVIESFASPYRDEPAPILMVNEPDRMALDHYLAKNGLGYYATVYINESVHEGVYLYSGKCQRLDSTMDKASFFTLNLGMRKKIGEERFMFTPLFIYLVRNNIISRDDPHFYTITMFPEKFSEVISTHYPELRLEQLSGELSYTNIFRVTGTASDEQINQEAES
jgi:hypothetical protein